MFCCQLLLLPGKPSLFCYQCASTASFRCSQENLLCFLPPQADWKIVFVCLCDTLTYIFYLKINKYIKREIQKNYNIYRYIDIYIDIDIAR